MPYCCIRSLASLAWNVSSMLNKSQISKKNKILVSLYQFTMGLPGCNDLTVGQMRVFYSLLEVHPVCRNLCTGYSLFKIILWFWQRDYLVFTIANTNFVYFLHGIATEQHIHLRCCCTSKSEFKWKQFGACFIGCWYSQANFTWPFGDAKFILWWKPFLT